MPDPLTHFARWISCSTGKRRAAIAFVAGSFSVLAFAPFFAAPVLFVTLPIFIWLIDGSANWRSAAWAGWWFGFGYFFFNLLWLGEAFLVEAEKFAVLLPFAVTLLPAGMAIFWALAASAARMFWCDGVSRIFVFVIALSVVEWLRGHVLTGLPWNVIGYALTAPLELMQGAAVIGAYGLTVVAILVFATPLVVLAQTGFTRRTVVASIAIHSCLPLVLLYGYGFWRLQEPETFLSDVRVRIVQPSVLQREKWKPEFQRKIFDDHLLLSVTNSQGVRDDLDGITHVIWPEAAMPFLPLEQPQALQEIGAILPSGRALVTGALRRDFTSADAPMMTVPPMFNSLLVFDDTGSLTAQYDKIHLVPFGEYLPLSPLLTALGFQKLTHGLGVFATGVEPRPVIDIAGLPTALALICYEVLFPGAIVQSASRPGVLINLTNDGWFGNSTGPRQHFHQSRVRAVEEGVPLIRAANNGISAVVDRYGRVLHSLSMNVRGVIDSDVPAGAAATHYSRFGDWGLALLLALVAGAAFVTRRAHREH
ncbi:MAG: apolipoprotein N-acyltransferase [Hyphomicrobium sp.]|nr:MAG: apolipoprotein N-acyltransferase [Hyphomicrobium sp.]